MKPELHPGMPSAATSPMGLAGRIAAFFLQARITPLLALVALLLGIFAVAVTPREEEPQIDVTMANVIIPFPGASPKQVEQSVSGPAEQVFSRMAGVEHVMSLSQAGVSVLTIQFKVGVPRSEAIVRLHDTAAAHKNWLPATLGVGEPIIRAKGIDDVPVVTLSLHHKASASNSSPLDLQQVAHALEQELKRVPGTRDVSTVGGPGRAIRVELDPASMQSAGISLTSIRQTIQSANLGMPVGELLQNNLSISLQAGPFLSNADEVAALVLAVQNGKPVYLRDVAKIVDGALPAKNYVWYGEKTAQGKFHEVPAISMAITKKPGENAVQVADALSQRLAQLQNTVIPEAVSAVITRNYGATANDKAQKLIQKLLFATASVVALVFLTLGRREALIVGIAVALTLTVTLFASWAWGFTLNRVSLFALIFSIGILVDDAIVVVENIHRHSLLYPAKSLRELIPGAVDEVGGPTILATLTVIAALLPMAFVSGLMGPYMSPIPINASMGMLISLAIAFILTPWLALRWLKHHPQQPADEDSAQPTSKLARRLNSFFQTLFAPFLLQARARANSLKLGLGLAVLIAISVALPMGGLVVLKMLPFDNKSEFQVILDMPAGTALEKTNVVLQEMSAEIARLPEVQNWQIYVGNSAPINFNGLVRQYELRSGPQLGDIQVNLLGKQQRQQQSHAIALQLRPALQKIAARYQARVKVVEVPPGPPVLAPIVAEIYGPDDASRRAAARQVQQVFQKTAGIVDLDTSDPATGPRQMLSVDRQKAALQGVAQADIVSNLRMGLSGEAVSYLHDFSKYPVPVTLMLADNSRGETTELFNLPVRAGNGKLIPLGEMLSTQSDQDAPAIWHKDLLPVTMVVADMAADHGLDSPLYGMFALRQPIQKLAVPGGAIQEYFIQPPSDPYRGISLKWDGEWQITYETFRDMGAAYAVGLVLIYLLVVAQFGSYLTPLIIMAPIPLTIIGVMPGHALLGAQYTATSMIGMIALAGIIVRNSILLVDFIELQVQQGMDFAQAVISSAATRAQPIALTALAAMAGAFFILDDPIFNGLAISLIFGILVSTVLTLLVIPLLYFWTYRQQHRAQTSS